VGGYWHDHVYTRSPMRMRIRQKFISVGY